MIDFLKKVKEKISTNLDTTEVILIDNSHLHTKHKSFSPEKFHIKLIIKSTRLKNMEKIKAHQEIFGILKDFLSIVNPLLLYSDTHCG